MNIFRATISQIESIDNLNIIKCYFLDQRLELLSLELGNGIKVGSMVELTTKPSNISIAKNFTGMVSCFNQIKSKIKEVENGELLSSIKLIVGESIIESIITKEMSLKMNLKEDDEVNIFINQSELSIFRVL